MKALINYYLKYCVGMWVEMNRCTDEHLLHGISSGKFQRSVVKGAHQRRLTNASVDSFLENINKAISINSQYYYFEELIDDVKKCVVKGIGDLTVYDTARRIGHVLPLAVYPQRYVYLARGAKIGAEKLLGRPVSFREPIDVFKPFFGDLPSICVEDILCIFHNFYIKGGVVPGLVIKGKLITIVGKNVKAPCCNTTGAAHVPNGWYDSKSLVAFDCMYEDENVDDGTLELCAD